MRARLRYPAFPSEASDANSRARLLSLAAPLFPSAALLLLSVLFTAAQMVSMVYDWDVDHFMYAGSRLLHGELLWTTEFDDKLPAMAFVFALPAAIHRVDAWFAISFTTSALAAWSLYTWLRDALRSTLSEMSARRVIAFSAAAWMFYAFAEEKAGGHGHINAFCVSLFVIAVTWMRPHQDPAPARSRTGATVRLVGAAWLAGMAVSLRPYLLLPTAALTAWLTAHAWLDARRGLEMPSRSSYKDILRSPSVFVVGFGFALFSLNCLPYVVTGQLNAFWSGLQMLTQELVRRPFLASVQSQAAHLRGMPLPWFCGLMVWLVGFFCWLKRARKTGLTCRTTLDWFVLAFVCPALVEISILAKHYWVHYDQMLVPFIAFGVAFALAYLAEEGVFNLDRRQASVFSIVAAFVVLAASRTAALDAVRLIAEGRGDSEGHTVAAFVEEVQENMPRHLRGFLVPTDMRPHWLVGEGRHGFPHAANTGFIVSGWWESLRVPPYFEIPRSTSEYCDQLARSAPSLLFVNASQAWLIDCLDAAGSAFSRSSLSRATHERASALKLVVFQRSSPQTR